MTLCLSITKRDKRSMQERERRRAAMMQRRQSSLCCDEGGDCHMLAEQFCHDLVLVSKLQETQRYLDIMQKIEDSLEKKPSYLSNIRGGRVLEDYQLVVDCTALLVDIENEIFVIHNVIRNNYRLKFPELQSFVHHPIDYARLVKKIGNEMDLTKVNLDGLLPSADIKVVTIAASTSTSGKPLPEQVFQKTIEACDIALALESSREKVLDFLETRMGFMAPNLSAIVGSAVAAKLVVTAGGLSALDKTPAHTVELFGAKKTNLVGFSTATTSQFCVGYIEQTEIVQHTPPYLRTRASELLAREATLAAFIDSFEGDPTGETGRDSRNEICKAIEKWQEPPPAKLPVPECKPKEKNVDCRLRKTKLRYDVTDKTKMANGMLFAIHE